MRESAVEAAFVARIKALGGEVRKVSWIGRRGAPDRVAMLPAPWRATTWVELKRPKADAEAHQAREHARMRKVGQTVLVIDTLELIDHYFPLPPKKD